MTAAEREEELIIAGIFKRPPRDFILDRPCYPYIKPDYTQMVNFDLNFKP